MLSNASAIESRLDPIALSLLSLPDLLGYKVCEGHNPCRYKDKLGCEPYDRYGRNDAYFDGKGVSYCRKLKK